MSALNNIESGYNYAPQVKLEAQQIILAGHGSPHDLYTYLDAQVMFYEEMAADADSIEDHEAMEERMDDYKDYRDHPDKWIPFCIKQAETLRNLAENMGTTNASAQLLTSSEGWNKMASTLEIWQSKIHSA